MKKLLLILTLGLALQGSFRIFASVNMSFTDFMSPEKNSSVVLINNTEFQNIDDSTMQTQIQRVSKLDPDLTFTHNYGSSEENKLLVRWCDHIFKPRDFILNPANATYENYRVSISSLNPIVNISFEGNYVAMINKSYRLETGKYSLIYSVFYNGNWYKSSDYILFAGQTPKPELGNPNRDNICVGEEITIPIYGTNEPGTKYTITYSDTTALKEEYDDNNPLPAFIKHTYKKNSCGSTYKTTDKTFNNAFSVTLKATNECGITIKEVGPIYVSSEPKSQIVTEKVTCVGETIEITNSNEEATIPDQETGNCTTSFKRIWTIHSSNGNTDFEVISGDLGRITNNNFPNDPFFWLSGSNKLEIKFKTAGRYIVTLKLANACFIKEIPQEIIVEPKIGPDFSIENIKNECGNREIKLTNTTSFDPNQFDKSSIPTYSWSVSPTGNYFINGSDANSIDPTFKFTNRGNYIITLTYTGTSCGPLSKSTDIITVKGVPTVKINDLNSCIQSDGQVKVQTSRQIETFGLDVLTYQWTITKPNGDIVTSDTSTPIFSFTETGNYKAKLTIRTDCGETTDEVTFVVAPMPIITKIYNIDVNVTTQINIPFCNGQITDIIKIEGNNATTGKTIDGVLRKFYWKNDNTNIGLVVEGYDEIPIFTAKNETTQPIIGKITVYPLNIGCQGDPIQFTITVNPSKDFANHKADTICFGEYLEPLKVIYNGIESNSAATYQWYSTDGIQQPQPISGATSTQFLPSNSLIGTTYYYCEITPKPGSGCSRISSLQDTITVNPTPRISNYKITIVKSETPVDLTPVNATNGNVIPAGTQYKWTITKQDARIIGPEDTTVFVDKIVQVINLPSDFSDPYAEIIYRVFAKTGDCEISYLLTVWVVPGITAKVKCVDMKCFGDKASIEITDIYGIMSGNTIVRLLDKNNNDKLVQEVVTTNNYVTFNNLIVGNYKVSITDQDGIYNETNSFNHECSFSEPAQLKFKDDKTKSYNAKCKGADNGEIYVEVEGGTRVNDYRFLVEKKNVSGSFVPYTTYTNPRIIINLSTGEYKLTVKDDNNCSIERIFTISEPDALSFTKTVTPVLNCDDDPNAGGKIVLSGPAGGVVSAVSKYRFTWYKKNQSPESGFLTIDQINDALKNIQEGIYLVAIYDENNCSHSEEVTILRAPALNASVDSVLTFDCDNHVIFKKYSITPTGGYSPYTIKWYDGPTQLAEGSAWVPQNSLQGKLITVKVTDARSCVFTLTVEPFFLHLPVFDFTNKQTGCNKYKFEAIVPPNVLGLQHTFKWNFANQHTGVGRNTEYDLDNVLVNANGEYPVQLIVVDNFTSCEYPVVTKSFKKNFIPDLNISSTGGSIETVDNITTIWFCEEETITVYGEGAASFSWSTGSNEDNINISNEGIFTLWGKNGLGCESSFSFKTKFYKWNYSISSDKNEINLGETVKFTTQPVVPFTQSYTWDFGDGSPLNTTDLLPYEHTYQFFAQDYFDILLTVKNPKGCNEYANKRITINLGNFPNTILPNSINVENRVFMKGCQVQIYNRNGVLIHEGADGWDGTHRGRTVMNDTYFYILTYLQSNGSQQTKKGYVTVIR